MKGIIVTYVLFCLVSLEIVAHAQIVVNPDGTHSIVVGNVAVNPNGTHSVIHGNIAINPDGTHSFVHGNVMGQPNRKSSEVIRFKGFSRSERRQMRFEAWFAGLLEKQDRRQRKVHRNQVRYVKPARELGNRSRTDK